MTKPKKLTKVQKEIAAVLEEGGWIGTSSFDTWTRPLLRADGSSTKRRVQENTIKALRTAGLIQVLRIEPALKVRSIQGGQFPDGSRNTQSVSRCIYIHTKNLVDVCSRLEGVAPSNAAAKKVLREAGVEVEEPEEPEPEPEPAKPEPRGCDGCRTSFGRGDQRIADSHSIPIGVLVYHPKCQDQALWNHIGLMDEATRNTLVKRLFAGTDLGGTLEVTIKTPNPNQAAAQLAYFLSNMGFIDTPGGAEWWQCRMKGWTPETLLDAYNRAGKEVAEKDTAFLWASLEDYL